MLYTFWNKCNLPTNQNPNTICIIILGIYWFKDTSRIN
jgi:hypothetical protein